MARILVLDAVLDAGVLIKRILQKKGHVVHVFHDEDEALGFTENYCVKPLDKNKLEERVARALPAEEDLPEQ